MYATYQSTRHRSRRGAINIDTIFFLNTSYGNLEEAIEAFKTIYEHVIESTIKKTLPRFFQGEPVSFLHIP